MGTSVSPRLFLARGDTHAVSDALAHVAQVAGRQVVRRDAGAYTRPLFSST